MTLEGGRTLGRTTFGIAQENRALYDYYVKKGPLSIGGKKEKMRLGIGGSTKKETTAPGPIDMLAMGHDKETNIT